MRRHQSLVGEHHHALAAHAAALHQALSHGARSGLDAEQLNLLLATSQLLQRSVQQLRQRHDEMLHALGLPMDGVPPSASSAAAAEAAFRIATTPLQSTHGTQGLGVQRAVSRAAAAQRLGRPIGQRPPQCLRQ